MNNGVAVLMSTYNGARYINEQIESILSQLSENDHLIVRDDGSTDDTVAIIRSWNDPRIQITCGNNIGFARSFFWLLYHVRNRYSIYMLSDQDDVWLPEKINRARQAISSTQEPLLFCTRLILVNETLQEIGLSPKIQKPASFFNAACENIATGCTIALNRSAISIIRSISYSDLIQHQIYYHDWWLYLNISYFGRVIWDPQPEILYRQHQTNTVGMSDGWQRYWKIWKAINNRSWVRILAIQLRAFLELNNSKLNAKDKDWLASLCKGDNLHAALMLIKDSKLQRQQPAGRWLFKLLVIYDAARGKLKNLPHAGLKY